MSGTSNRRLAAIVAADVVGYSRLIGRDETGTIAALRAHRSEFLDPLVERHGGRIVKTMGDGVLLEFPSIVDATRCAAEIQAGMAERNEPIAPDTRIELRIGVNLGDIVIDGDDILGDGVNVAARLEGLAPPGGICITRAVHEQIRDRLDLAFEDLGEIEVKNIARPLAVFRWPPDTGTTRAAAASPAAPGEARLSLAVLPFENMSADPEQDYFTDGITEDVITELARFRDLKVIDRNSVFPYQGHRVDLARIAEELAVRYVVQGSVRRAGDRIRLTVRLTDTTSRESLWSERFDRAISDIFALQDELSGAIVRAVAPRSIEAETQRMAHVAAGDSDVWDTVARARHLSKALDQDSAERFYAFVEEALARHREVAALHSLKARQLIIRVPVITGVAREEVIQQAESAALAAMRLDPQDGHPLASLAGVRMFQRRFDEARDLVARSIALNPNAAFGHGTLACINGIFGNFDVARAALDAALELSPNDPDKSFWYAGAMIGAFTAGDYAAAVAIASDSIAFNPTFATPFRQRAAALAMLGRLEEARADVARLLELQPLATLADTRRLVPIDGEPMERFVDALRAAGLPD